MEEDKKRRESAITEQVSEEILKLVTNVEDGIKQLTDDFTKTHDGEITVFEWFGAYDDFLLTFIQGLMIERNKRRQEFAEKSLSP